MGAGGGGGDDDSLGDEDGWGDAGIGGGDGGGCGEYCPACPLVPGTAMGEGSGLLADRCGGGSASRGSGDAGGDADTAAPPNTSSRCTMSHFVSSLIAFACDATVARSALSMRGRMSAGPNAYASLSTLTCVSSLLASMLPNRRNTSASTSR